MKSSEMNSGTTPQSGDDEVVCTEYISVTTLYIYTKYLGSQMHK